MRELLRAIKDRDIYFMMAILAVLTLGTGLVLGNPKVHSFASPAWGIFAELRVGPIEPTEEQWGVLIAGLAFLQVITMWQLAGNAGSPGVTKFARLVWGLTCALYFGIGSSFFLNNATGVGYLLALVPGCAMSARVCVRVRHLVEGSGGGQGG